jgi:acyl-CoA thioester hydrolase
MRKRGVLGAEIEITVPFYDVDRANIVWHGHYAKYLEDARCALFAAIGYGYDDMRDDGYIWPVIDLRLRYIRPALFAQRLNVRAELIEWRERLLINYLITDARSGQRLTRATTTQVAVSMDRHAILHAPLPRLLRAVEEALAKKA